MPVSLAQLSWSCVDRFSSGSERPVCHFSILNFCFESDHNERHPKQSKKGWGIVTQVPLIGNSKSRQLPKNCKSSPRQTKRHQKNIYWRKNDRFVGLARPNYFFIGQQIWGKYFFTYIHSNHYTGWQMQCQWRSTTTPIPAKFWKVFRRQTKHGLPLTLKLSSFGRL